MISSTLLFTVVSSVLVGYPGSRILKYIRLFGLDDDSYFSADPNTQQKHALCGIERSKLY
jgi:hypothetical protein